MESPRVIDDTDFRSQPTRVYAASGPRLLMVVKASFAMKDPGAELAPMTKLRQRPLRFADEPWGEPASSAIRYPFDMSPEKSGTDVVFVGSAHSPERRPRETIDAVLKAGLLTSAVRAVGPRTFGPSGDSLTEPLPALAIPIRWDHAWGGFEATLDGKVAEEPRNPIGRGVCVKRENLTGRAAPTNELPGEPIRSANDNYTPAGLGAIGRNFAPRRALGGTFDAAWHSDRAPLPPLDQDPKFTSFAAPGLHSKKSFYGVETIALHNLTAGGGAVSVPLPRVVLDVVFRGERIDEERFRPALDTVIVDTSDEAHFLVLELVYRASIAAPRRLGDVEIVVEEELA